MASPLRPFRDGALAPAFTGLGSSEPQIDEALAAIGASFSLPQERAAWDAVIEYIRSTNSGSEPETNALRKRRATQVVLRFHHTSTSASHAPAYDDAPARLPEATEANIRVLLLTLSTAERPPPGGLGHRPADRAAPMSFAVTYNPKKLEAMTGAFALLSKGDPRLHQFMSSAKPIWMMTGLRHSPSRAYKTFRDGDRAAEGVDIATEPGVHLADLTASLAECKETAVSFKDIARKAGEGRYEGGNRNSVVNNVGQNSTRFSGGLRAGSEKSLVVLLASAAAQLAGCTTEDMLGGKTVVLGWTQGVEGAKDQFYHRDFSPDQQADGPGYTFFVALEDTYINLVVSGARWRVLVPKKHMLVFHGSLLHCGASRPVGWETEERGGAFHRAGARLHGYLVPAGPAVARTSAWPWQGGANVCPE